MIGIEAENSEPIDCKTSRSICDAVGERLQQGSAAASVPTCRPICEQLLNELRRQDDTEPR